MFLSPVLNGAPPFGHQLPVLCLQFRHHGRRPMEGEQDSRKRKLAALKARREQGNLANAALVDKEEARFVRNFVISLCVPPDVFCRRKPLIVCCFCVCVSAFLANGVRCEAD